MVIDRGIFMECNFQFWKSYSIEIPGRSLHQGTQTSNQGYEQGAKSLFFLILCLFSHRNLPRFTRAVCQLQKFTRKAKFFTLFIFLLLNCLLTLRGGTTAKCYSMKMPLLSISTGLLPLCKCCILMNEIVIREQSEVEMMRMMKF